ncbi:DUF1077-domain-containing protein [Cylindrobasidium torrendii FP15055 ss-10]|uniref:ER membrane protein complex subunit 4 n=1 Tax=Cylindrobasidium torrendii FP15055 ss-10 TaxID=1314674 RepID=A0A0D7AWE8_9AGAR|nr:DUF1077-domain-containing protein [Cylindrobasidium torrendii FP15055 ss-10]
MSITLDYASLEAASKWRSLPPPPGFSKSLIKAAANKNAAAGQAPAAYDALKEKRAWDMAISPAKSLPMQAFMLYMSGSGVQIFSMGIVAMLLFSPFKNIAGINAAFAQFAPSGAPPHSFATLLLQKLVYIACNILTLAVGLYKCRQMGLLPLGTGDWLAFETRGNVRVHPFKGVNCAYQSAYSLPNYRYFRSLGIHPYFLLGVTPSSLRRSMPLARTQPSLSYTCQMSIVFSRGMVVSPQY